MDVLRSKVENAAQPRFGPIPPPVRGMHTLEKKSINLRVSKSEYQELLNKKVTAFILDDVTNERQFQWVYYYDKIEGRLITVMSLSW